MRIAVDIRPLAEPYPSGVSRYTAELLSALLRDYGQRHRFTLFSYGRREVPADQRALYLRLGVRYHHWRWPSKLVNGMSILRLLPGIDRLAGGSDVLFVPNMNYLSVSGRCRLVCTVHDLSYTHPGFYGVRAQLWHRMVGPGRIFRRADSLIAVSEFTKRDVVHTYRVPEGRVQVVRSGVNREQFMAPSDTAAVRVRQRYQLSEPYVLFLGNVEPRKNIPGLLEAWRILQTSPFPYQLVLAGSVVDPSWLRRHPGVRFLGYIPEEDKPALYRGATLFVYPSFYEGFGMPVLEAMASGCPVITSQATALPEVAGDAAILVDPYNVNELAEAIRQVATQESLRRSLIESGLRRVEQFTWKRAAAETMAVLERVGAQ
ncbi:MAG: glycosyltransferase family 1 protein [Patescibacteria group bacterium]